MIVQEETNRYSERASEHWDSGVWKMGDGSTRQSIQDH